MADEDDVIEQEAEDQHEADPPTLNDVEKLASELGWAPKGDWKGEESEWVDAPQFIKDSRTILKKTLARQDTELADMKETLKQFAEHHRTTEERAYKRAKADLEKQHAEAVEEGDAAEASRLRSEIDGLEPPPEPKKPNGDAVNPHFPAFQADNAWYGKDYAMTAYADQIGPIVARNGFTDKAFYDEVARATREEFRDRGKNPARQRPQNVEDGGPVGPGRKTNGKGYSDLPPEAKAACDRFIKQGLYTGDDGKPLPQDKARAKYAAAYEWD